MSKKKKRQQKNSQSLKAPVYNLEGRKIGEATLLPELFARPASSKLLSQAVRVYLANQRTAYPKVKTRGEVRGSRRKIWPQKGTGRARHGDRYAPIFVGGGVAHGPTGKQNYKLKLPKKMRRRAFAGALTWAYQQGLVAVVDSLSQLKPKTKQAVGFLAKLSRKIEKLSLARRILLVLPTKETKEKKVARLSFANLPQIELATAGALTTYQVLSAHFLLFTKTALVELQKQRGK